MEDIMALMGSPLGFVTDRDDPATRKQGVGPYDVETVRDCMMVAVLQGGRVVGNEFNIIASRAYMTKAYFKRVVNEFPGVTDVQDTPGVPVLVGDKGALCPFVITWKLYGVRCSFERIYRKGENVAMSYDERIPIRVNAYMGTDAIIGKATRKAYAAVYARLTGSDITEGEVEESEPAKIATSLTAITEKLEAKAPGDVTVDAGASEAPGDPPAKPVTLVEEYAGRLLKAKTVDEVSHAAEWILTEAKRTNMVIDHEWAADMASNRVAQIVEAMRK
jgi:hypothetical protein